MINLVQCPICLKTNYLEAAALSLHVDLRHLTRMDLWQRGLEDQTADHA